jgi:hypothetical protein
MALVFHENPLIVACPASHFDYIHISKKWETRKYVLETLFGLGSSILISIGCHIYE